jgi:hypothetical protein
MPGQWIGPRKARNDTEERGKLGVKSWKLEVVEELEGSFGCGGCGQGTRGTWGAREMEGQAPACPCWPGIALGEDIGDEIGPSVGTRERAPPRGAWGRDIGDWIRTVETGTRRHGVGRGRMSSEERLIQPGKFRPQVRRACP